MAKSTSEKVKSAYIEEWLDMESSVPIKVQRNIAKLLEEHLEGINITSFAKLYKKKYNVELIVTHYEASSLLQLMGKLDNLVRQVVLRGQDIILFPAFLPKGEIEINLRRGIDCTPKVIIENIKKLLISAKSENPKLGGIYYDDFLVKYEARFGAPLEFLMYNSSTFDEFIEKQVKTWLKVAKVDGKSVIMYYVEENEEKQTLYPLDQIQKIDRNEYPAGVISPHEHLKNLNFNDEFKVGDKVDVCITEASSCDRFYMHLEKYSDELAILDRKMDYFYENERDTVKIPHWVPASGMFCATYFTNKNEWYRVQISEVASNGVCRCYYVDVGKRYNLNPKNVYYLKNEFSELPMQAICASLAYSKPAYSSDWSYDSKKRFRELILSRSMVAEIVSIDPETPNVTVNLFYNETNVLDILISEKLAKRTEIEESFEYFNIKKENLTLIKYDDAPSVTKTDEQKVDSGSIEFLNTSQPILSCDFSKKEDELLNVSNHQSSTFSDHSKSSITIPTSFNTPPPFYKTKSMPILTKESEVSTSSAILNDSNNSLTNLNESQANYPMTDFSKPKLVDRPLRCCSTPAVTRNFQNNSPPYSPLHTLTSPTNTPPPFNLNYKSNSPPVPPPTPPFYSYTPAMSPNRVPFHPYPPTMPFPNIGVQNHYNYMQRGQYPPPYAISYYNRYMPTPPGYSYNALYGPPHGFHAGGFSQQSPYYLPHHNIIPDPWMTVHYFQPPANDLTQASSNTRAFPETNKNTNVNNLSHEQQKSKEPHPSFCLAKSSEMSLKSSASPEAMEDKQSVESSNVLATEQNGNRESLSRQRRPLLESNITDFLNRKRLREETPIPLEIQIMDFNIFDKVIHKVVLNNKVFLIEDEIITKLSAYVDTDVFREKEKTSFKFVPSRRQYPLLYDELRKKQIGDPLQTLHLIPITEFPRAIYEAGITSKQIMHEALRILIENSSIKDLKLDDI